MMGIKKTDKREALNTAPARKSRKLKNGTVTMIDLLAPPMVDRSDSDSDHLKVGNKYVRSYMITGYPKQIAVRWADDVYDHNGDLDLALHIIPMDERAALDELTNKITQFQAQLDTELEKGSNRNITRLQSQINDLVEERRHLEQNYISLFEGQMIMNLYGDSLDALNKEGELVQSAMRGRKVDMPVMYFRQDQGYKSALPYGRSWLPENFRNFSSSALTACFPFYNSEISHPSGVMIGVNVSTKTPMYVDFYDRTLLDSGNTTTFGMTGSGKTFFTSLILMRSALAGVKQVIIDPEGEYRSITETLGGINIRLAPDGEIPNPFDVSEEDVLDGDDMPTGEKIVNLNDKIMDVLGLIGVMTGNMSNEQKSLVSAAISKTYRDFGITEDPASLYEEGAAVNDEGALVHANRRKKMPTISDLYERIVEFSEEQKSDTLRSVANALLMFKSDGVLGMFDHETPEELLNMEDVPVVCFDVRALNDDTLRPIGMYIALSWCMEKFIKQNPSVKKRILCDEAWMMVRKSMAGSEYTSHFLENLARRIRKRNGTLWIASQNFKEFVESAQGEAILFNTHVNIFFKQNDTDIDAVQDKFKLSGGEKEFLAAAQKGHFLIKIGRESAVGFAHSFKFERDLIERKARLHAAKE